jgi:hypothetical protein
MQLVRRGGKGTQAVTEVHFGVVRSNGWASFLTSRYVPWHFDGRQWSTRNPNPEAPAGAGPAGIEAGKREGTRLLDVDGDGVCEAILRSQGADWLCRWMPERDTFVPQCRLPEDVQVVDDRGRDAGLRFVDVDEDGRLDLVFSDAQQYSLYLFTSIKEGWSRKVLAGKRGKQEAKDEIPPIVRADGTNNGAWFGLRHMWVQNEQTGGKSPGHVFGRRFTQLLHGDHRPPSPSPEG